ncbi:ATP-grasp domain-containing protein [Francisella sciaenopsi]|uniref:ATP-grasp domain-containing protein n=1 Tax=Francisella sciaenopsi TaxID=3055034 RepID=A0ABQ6PHH3_9GAMM
MNKKKILISGAGGSIFPYLFGALEEKYDIYAMDSDEKIGLIYPNKNIIISPKVDDPKFNDQIGKIIDDYNIDYYISGIDEEILKAIEIGKDKNISVLSPCSDFVKVSLDKYELMKSLKDLGISDIPTVMADQYTGQFDYPIFLKPNVGRGSRGIKKIESLDQFEAYFILEEYEKSEVLVQPYIGGDEYTVSVTVNNLNDLMAVVPKLVFTKQGITRHAISIQNEKIVEKCRDIVNKMKPYGTFNVQLKIYNEEIYIFEINPRISTTLVLSVESGVNEIDLMIEYFDKKYSKKLCEFSSINLVRRWENCFYE